MRFQLVIVMVMDVGECAWECANRACLWRWAEVRLEDRRESVRAGGARRDREGVGARSVVNVPMFVAFGNVQPDAYEHENARNAERPIEPTLPEGEGESSARERRSGKIGPCSRCAETTERLHEKNETDAIAKETNDRHTESDVNGWEFRANGESQSGVDDACGETFPHRDLRRIAAGNFAGEVVVNSPTEAG